MCPICCDLVRQAVRVFVVRDKSKRNAWTECPEDYQNSFSIGVHETSIDLLKSVLSRAISYSARVCYAQLCVARGVKQVT
jgi:hypothetical protein